MSMITSSQHWLSLKMAQQYGTFKDLQDNTEDTHESISDVQSIPCDAADSTPDAETWPEWLKGHKKSIAANLMIYCGIFSVSVCLQMIGPSLLDLQLRLHTTIDRVTWLLSAKASGALVGVLLAGKTMETRLRWFQLTAAVALVSICCAAVPWPKHLLLSLAIFPFFGMARAYYWCGANLTTFALWDKRKNSLSWLVGQQLCGSLGSMVGPLIVKPFLAETNRTTTDELLSVWIREMNSDPFIATPTSNSYANPYFLSTNEDLQTFNSDTYGNSTSDSTNVMYGFLIAGGIGLTTAVGMIIGFFALGGIYFDERRSVAANSSTPRRKCLRYTIIALFVLNNTIFGSVTRDYMSYMVAFTVHQLKWTKSESAYLASTLGLSGIASKVLCIYLVRIVKLEIQLFFGMLLALSASLLLLFLGEKYYFIPWLVTVLYSVGLTNISSTVFGWVDKILEMRGLVGVLWNMGGCLGEIIAPFILGHLFRYVSYTAFVYYFAACMSAFVLLWIVLQILGQCYRRQPYAREELLINT